MNHWRIVPSVREPQTARIGVLNRLRQVREHPPQRSPNLNRQVDMQEPTCSIDGCDKPVKVKKYGWCSVHYGRWSEHGDPLADVSRRRLGQCCAEECDKPAKAQNLCTKHYTRLLRYGSSEVTHPPGTPAQQTTCKAGEECDGMPIARDLCPKHYARWRAHGTPILARPTVDERFWAKVDKNGPIPERCPELGPCWLWTAATNKGYGVYNLPCRPTQRAYRVTYEFAVGAIPDDLELDHLCRVRACVNPRHLEPVTHKVNTLRGESPFALHAAQTYCVNGHEFTPENTYWRKRAEGGRTCRTCARDQQRSRQRARRLAKQAAA